MKLTNQFQSFVNRCARGSSKPELPQGKVHEIDSEGFGPELYDEVSRSVVTSTVKTNLQKPDLAGDSSTHATANQMLELFAPKDSRAGAAANQILNHVQSALGGIPASFGMAETSVEGDQPFFVRIHKAQEVGGAYQDANPSKVDAVAYVDPGRGTLFIDTNPGDRFGPNMGPWDGAAHWKSESTS